VPSVHEQIFINMHVIKKKDTPNTKASKELYEYKNIKEREGNKNKEKVMINIAHGLNGLTL